MGLKRRIEFAPNSIGFPIIPRGPRSVRRRVSHKDNIEDNEICSFELLAAVAGKLLQESESSASSNVAVEKDPFLAKLLHVRETGFGKGKQEIVKALAPECPDRGSCVESSCRFVLPAKRSDSKTVSRKLIRNESNTLLEMGSIISELNMSKNDGDKVKLEIPDKKECVKDEGGSPNCGESSNGYVDNSNERDLEAKGRNFNHFADIIGTNISKDKLKINVNYYPLINSDSSVHLTSFRDSVPYDSFLRRRNNVNVSTRDDDENFIRFNQCKPKFRAFRPRSFIGYRRIRKLSTSKYWKVAPKLKDCEFSNSERGMKHISYNRKSCHTSQRIRWEGPFKKRKLFDGSPRRHASHREGSSESISNILENGMKREKIGGSKSRKGCGISSPFVGQGPSYQSMDSHVKFSIKSFKVPELYIEVPETSTVGSLKRTVMEAVTAILQEGLRVGVLLQGEKVKDDERTLLQTGISQNGNLDNLGFSLEPISTIAPPPVFSEVPITLLPCETPQQLIRFLAGPLLESGITSTLTDPLEVVNLDTNVISNHELVPFPTDIVTNDEMPDSGALVPLPSVSKVKRTELAQRRTRTPFSVTEVEALVEAVETLGTGRWRDVKLRSFEATDHRTYVDLKVHNPLALSIHVLRSNTSARDLHILANGLVICRIFV